MCGRDISEIIAVDKRIILIWILKKLAGGGAKYIIPV
jgi:hypothetical protein